jgi:uncharacterized protein YabE (DUF348 family)
LALAVIIGGASLIIIKAEQARIAEEERIAEENRTETVQITETEELPFEEQTIDDATLAKGATQIKQEGETGIKTKTYKVTKWVHKDQSEIERVLISEEITKEPVAKITAVGTRAAVQSSSSSSSGKPKGSTAERNAIANAKCADAVDVIQCKYDSWTAYNNTHSF